MIEISLANCVVPKKKLKLLLSFNIFFFNFFFYILFINNYFIFEKYHKKNIKT